MEFWEKAEKWAARHFNCKIVFGSGRGNLKSDFSSVGLNSKGQEIQLEGGIRGEVKSSIKEEISLQTRWFIKIIKESYLYKQTPVLFILLGDLKGWAISPVEDSEETEYTKFKKLSKSFEFTSKIGETLETNKWGLFIPNEIFEEHKVPVHLRYNKWKVISAD